MLKIFDEVTRVKIGRLTTQPRESSTVDRDHINTRRAHTTGVLRAFASVDHAWWLVTHNDEVAVYHVSEFEFDECESQNERRTY